MSFNALGKAVIGWHDIAHQKEDRVEKKFGPGISSPEKASETDHDQDQGDQEEEYAAPVIAPPGQCCDKTLTQIGFEIE